MNDFDKLEAIPFPAVLWRVESEDPGDTRLVGCNKLARSVPGAIHRYIGQTVREFIPNTLGLPREFNTAEATLRVAQTGEPEHFPKVPFRDPTSDIPPAVFNIHITRWEANLILFTYEVEEMGGISMDALFQIERRLRMLEHLPGYIVVLDNEGTITEINRMSPAYAGMDFVGRKQWEMGLPEAADRIHARWLQFLHEDEGDHPVDVPGLPEGSWYRLWYTRLDPWTVLCTIIDVTDVKVYEQELVERNLELARSNEDLSQFAYAASHDLQEPLRTITSYLNILVEDLGPQLSDEMAEYIRFITQASLRMKELIEGLLRYARVESQGEPMGEVDLNEAVTSTIKLFRSHPVHFEVDPLPKVMGDKTQIRQVFENLINNSIRYRKPGTAAQVHIRHLGTTDGFHEFVVEDDGIGIAPEYHEMIFQIFKRLHTRQEYDGTGIGLALVRRIVDRHGGRVWVRSAEGDGADFHFTLPVNAFC